MAIRTENGLVYDGERMLMVFEADRLARALGHQYAEGLVRELERRQKLAEELSDYASAVEDPDPELAAKLREAASLLKEVGQ